MTAANVDAALDYAARGWPVFPCRPGGKAPATKHGLHDATVDPDQIRRWWTNSPDANVGLATGEAFDVIDLDGLEALDAIDAAGPGQPRIIGPMVTTPRPGVHIYVLPSGRGNTAGLLDHVDYRGLGGYVIGAPSTRPDGDYWWSEEYGIDAPMHEAPAWLLACWDAKKHPAPVPAKSGRPTTGHTGASYGIAALDGELGRLAQAPEGARNDALNRGAFSLGQLIASGHLDARTVANELLTVALRIGLTETEAAATIKSGFASGMSSPRAVQL